MQTTTNPSEELSRRAEIAAKAGAFTDVVAKDVDLAALERELATELARSDLECYAAEVDRPAGQMPRYDTSRLNEGRAAWMNPDDLQADLARAVRHLDLRGLLVRPIPGQPHIVSIAPALLATVEGGAV